MESKKWHKTLSASQSCWRPAVLTGALETGISIMLNSKHPKPCQALHNCFCKCSINVLPRFTFFAFSVQGWLADLVFWFWRSKYSEGGQKYPEIKTYFIFLIWKLFQMQAGFKFVKSFDQVIVLICYNFGIIWNIAVTMTRVLRKLSMALLHFSTVKVLWGKWSYFHTLTNKMTPC